jgi:hypothetical protein
LFAEFTAEMAFTIVFDMMLSAYIVFDTVSLAAFVIKELTIGKYLSGNGRDMSGQPLGYFR